MRLSALASAVAVGGPASSGLADDDRQGEEGEGEVGRGRQLAQRDERHAEQRSRRSVRCRDTSSLSSLLAHVPPLSAPAAARGSRRPRSARRLSEAAIEVEVQQQHVDARLTQEAERPALDALRHEGLDLGQRRRRARPPRAGACQRAASGLRCGSRPLAEAVTSSTGTGPGACGFSARRRCEVGRDAVAQLLRASGPGSSRRRPSRRSRSRPRPRAAAGSRPAS